MPKLKNPSNCLETPLLEKSVSFPTDMKRVGVIILGGGKGTRLFPLTQSRCKPAMSFGGRYRLIDVPISNSINSGCHKIFIITQFLSSSLHQHIFQTYRHATFPSGFLELLPAEQRPSSHEWFQGTADAVRQNLDYFIETPVDYFLILSGDQLYKMNYLHMLHFSRQTNADVVIASLPVSALEASRMGILKIDQDNFVTDFCEKPQQESELLPFKGSSHEKPYLGSLNKKPYLGSLNKKPYLGSMGIYLFKREALCKLLSQDLREDFGKHLIPTKVKQGGVAAYIHQGYWEDIGTVSSFYQANMALTEAQASFNLYDENWPIYSNDYFLQGPKFFDSYCTHSIIGEGSLIEAKEISHSILGARTVVHSGTIIRDSYIMGNDFYTPPLLTGRLPKTLHIGKNSIIQKAILDKHIHIGNNVSLTNKNNLNHYNGEDVYIRDGIIIVPCGVSLPDGFTL